mgnify:CR=1 FL=1
MLGTPQPKGRPHVLMKRERHAAVKARDEAESRKVRKRSGGRCEAEEWVFERQCRSRCRRRASEVHHMKGGIGRRGRGDSALARFKQHLCTDCHENIRLHILVPFDPQADALHVIYRRVK